MTSTTTWRSRVPFATATLATALVLAACNATPPTDEAAERESETLINCGAEVA